MEAKVYYWKDIRYLTQLEYADTPAEMLAAFPDRQQFETDYAQVTTIHCDCFSCDTEGRPEGTPTPISLANVTWDVMNADPARHFRRGAYAEGVHHTSMSVADIVIISELALIAVPCGWEQIRFEEHADRTDQVGGFLGKL